MAVGIGGLAVTAVAIAVHVWWFAIPGVAALLLAAFIGRAFFAATVVIVEDGIDVGRRFRTQVPLADVAAVGLVYRPTMAASSTPAWTLALWDSSGLVYQLPVSYSLPPEAGGPGSPTAGGFDPVSGNNLQALSASPAAMAARAIYEGALRKQGPDGPLIRRTRERHDRTQTASVSTSLTAIWSPDGTIWYAEVAGPGEQYQRR